MNNTKKPIQFDSGFDPGDDNKIQKAMLDNLEKTHSELVASGNTTEAESTKADIDALKTLMETDKTQDPFDQTPDDLDIEEPTEE